MVCGKTVAVVVSAVKFGGILSGFWARSCKVNCAVTVFRPHADGAVQQGNFSATLVLRVVTIKANPD
jgi:hypothetical protein